MNPLSACGFLLLITIQLSFARLSGPGDNGNAEEPQFQIEAPSPLAQPLTLHELVTGNHRVRNPATSLPFNKRKKNLLDDHFQASQQQHPATKSIVKRGAAYAGGHGDFSGVAKQSTFAALGSYGGYLGHGKGSTAGGYGAGSGNNGLDAAGGITISGALGSYGGYLGHKGPTVISSGGFGHGGLLFGKI